uniref:Uncharacterized protein n=1 Tax=Arundo donax TaxID=35708 RepID=A0A0A9EBE9_ARUDO
MSLTIDNKFVKLTRIWKINTCNGSIENTVIIPDRLLYRVQREFSRPFSTYHGC